MFKEKGLSSQITITLCFSRKSGLKVKKIAFFINFEILSLFLIKLGKPLSPEPSGG